LIIAYQKCPDDESLQIRLISQYKNLVGSLSGKYSGHRETREDLYQVGMVGLISALKRYNPSYGRSFESFAVPTIVGELKRYIRDKTWSVHVPRRIKELSLRVRRISDELTGSLQRFPNIREIADELGESEKQVLETMEMTHSYRALSVDSEIENNPGKGTATLLDLVGRPDQGYERVHKKMLLEAAFRILSKQEKEVLLFTYFDNMSQKEVGQHLGISQMHTSRIQRRALDKLRNFLDSDGKVMNSTY
jgi:RNA polymerase sigma-B factor